MSTSKDIRQEVDDFAQTSGTRLRSIAHRLSRNKFEFAPSKGILSAKRDALGKKTGKVRPIVLAPLESRIVQRALLDVLMEYPQLEIYINTPFSFGGVRKSQSGRSKGGKAALSGVPAAIECVLNDIGHGSRYYASADIKSFFTRISKKSVLETIGKIVQDTEFVAFLEQAIAIELANMEELREHADVFPIQDIGVAQGSSLSPMLGNIVLAKFDLEMNRAGFRCVRYVDDFVILGSTQKEVNAQLRRAKRLLSELNMEMSAEKSSKGACPVEKGMSFLGINVVPGFIRPSSKTQQRFISAVEDEFKKARDALRDVMRGKPLNRRFTLIATLKRVDGMVDGWGKAYWFCNDVDFLRHTDFKITELTRAFLGFYPDTRVKVPGQVRDSLLGISRLSDRSRKPFEYPVSKSKS